MISPRSKRILPHLMQQTRRLNAQPASRCRAFSLVEVLMAMGILTLGAVAVLGLLATGMKAQSDGLRDSWGMRAAQNYAAMLRATRPELTGISSSTFAQLSAGDQSQLPDAETEIDGRDVVVLGRNTDSLIWSENSYAQDFNVDMSGGMQLAVFAHDDAEPGNLIEQSVTITNNVAQNASDSIVGNLSGSTDLAANQWVLLESQDNGQAYVVRVVGADTVLPAPPKGDYRLLRTEPAASGIVLVWLNSRD